MKQTIASTLIFLLAAAPAVAGTPGGGSASGGRGSAGSHTFTMQPAWSVGSSQRRFQGGGSDPASGKGGDFSSREDFKVFPDGAQPHDGVLVEQRPRRNEVAAPRCLVTAVGPYWVGYNTCTLVPL